MKNIQYKIERKLSLLVVFFIFILLGVQAQSNLTNTLGITDSDLVGNTSTYDTYYFSSRQIELPDKADCFLVTLNLPKDYITTNLNFVHGFKRKLPIFTLDGKDLSSSYYQIGVENVGTGNPRWYIEIDAYRHNHVYSLNYEIYDDLGLDGNFTFIFGSHFTAIAVDDGATNFKLAPVFFGMGTSLIREITEHSDSGYFIPRRPTKIWKMSGDAKIATLISLLNKSTKKVTNAKAANNTKVAALPVHKDENNLEDKNNLIKNLKLYPNPSNGTFNLDFSTKENNIFSFKILNLNGQIVFEQRNLQFNKGNNKHTFEMANKLVKGIYILETTSLNYSKFTKLVIK